MIQELSFLSYIQNMSRHNKVIRQFTHFDGAVDPEASVRLRQSLHAVDLTAQKTFLSEYSNMF